jgi:hypothetical protein|eukprot:COSAG01_NODE_628_length_14690_cov_1156.936947_4_plen_33_part_00
MPRQGARAAIPREGDGRGGEARERAEGGGHRR